MRSPRTNGLKNDPRIGPDRPPRGPWDTRSAHSEPCRGGRTAVDVGPPPLNGTPDEKLAWTLAVLQQAHARVDTMIDMTKEMDRQIDRLGKSVVELWRMLIVCFAIVAVGAVIGAVCAWLGV